VEVIALERRASFWRVGGILGDPPATRPPAGALAQGGPALHGRGHEQDLGVVLILLEWGVLLVHPEPSALEEVLDLAGDDLDEGIDLFLAGSGYRVELQQTGLGVADVDTV